MFRVEVEILDDFDVPDDRHFGITQHHVGILLACMATDKNSLLRRLPCVQGMVRGMGPDKTVGCHPAFEVSKFNHVKRSWHKINYLKRHLFQANYISSGVELNVVNELLPATQS